MRSFSFRAKNIGRERYLTYIMGEGCELDEDVLDYCEENKLKELVQVIYEEDDDFDYLTYDITGKMTLEKFTQGVMNREKVFKIVRNIALGLVNLKEQAIHLSYILLNKGFVYVNPDSLDLEFICLPVESESSLSAEFKGFIRQLLANMKYNVEEDLSYVGQLLTYINSDSFNLRGLIALSEALMEDAGISFEEEEGIATDDGAEIVNLVDDEPEEEPKKTGSINEFMSDLGNADDVLPEIGDDEEEEAFEETEDSEDIKPEAPVAEPEESEEPVVSASVSEKTEESKMPVPEPEETEESKKSALEPEKTEEPKKSVPEPEETEESKKSAPEPKETEEPIESAAKQREAKPTEAAVKENQEAEPKEDDIPAEKEKPKMAESLDEIKARLERIVNGEPAVKQRATAESINTMEDLDDIIITRPVVKKNTIKVNRAAIIQNAVEQEHEADTAEKQEEIKEIPDVAVTKSSKNTGVKKDTIIENIDDSLNSEASVAEKPKNGAKPEEAARPIKSSSILSKGTSSVNNTMLGTTGTLKICPYLIRVNTEERIMITKAVFKIGKANRGVDYTVDGNGAISRQHAVILQKDGVYYIKDNKSTNHTYVNGKKVEDGQEEILTHDCKVKLGDEEFLFKIR